MEKKRFMEKKPWNACKIWLHSIENIVHLSNDEERYLNEIWTDTKQPATFSGPYKLYQIVKREGKYKIALQRIKQFLSDTDAYSLQKKVHRKFKRSHIITDLINTIWDGDLQDVRNISKYILVLQDIFSPIPLYRSI